MSNEETPLVGASPEDGPKNRSNLDKMERVPCVIGVGHAQEIQGRIIQQSASSECITLCNYCPWQHGAKIT